MNDDLGKQDSVDDLLPSDRNLPGPPSWSPPTFGVDANRFDKDGYDENGWRRHPTTTEHRFLRQFFAWGEAEPGDTRDFEEVLVEAEDERPLQRFLEERPRLLAATFLRGGHGRYVHPQLRLGSQYVADFMIADESSMGLFWTLIEIESPNAEIYLTNGEWAEKARHAQHQIRSWRQWLKENLDYARKLPPNGLGAVDVEPNPQAVILIGRRSQIRADSEWMRKALRSESQIHLATYDYLLDTIRRSEHEVVSRQARSDGPDPRP